MSNKCKNPVLVMRGFLLAICTALAAALLLHGHEPVSSFFTGFALGVAIGATVTSFSVQPTEWRSTDHPSGVEPLQLTR